MANQIATTKLDIDVGCVPSILFSWDTEIVAEVTSINRAVIRFTYRKIRNRQAIHGRDLGLVRHIELCRYMF